MSTTKMITCRIKKGEPKVAFAVENWPGSTTEALRLWGETRCNHALFGTSAIVQVQGFFRGLCTRKKKRLTVAQARDKCKSWKPSDGQRERVSKPEKAARVLSEMTRDEGVAFIVESFGVDTTEAGKMFAKVVGKQGAKKKVA